MVLSLFPQLNLFEGLYKSIPADSGSLNKLKTHWVEAPDWNQYGILTNKDSYKKRKIGITLSGGFVAYQFQFREMVDTPFAEKNLAQHFLTAQWGMVINERIPVRVTYSQRKSNSSYFRDYLDIKLELDNGQLNRIQQQGLQQYFSRSMDRWRDPLLRPIMDLTIERVKGLGNWLNDREVKNRYLDSRLLLSAPSLPDTFKVPVDTLVAQARTFVRLYDEVRGKTERYAKAV